MCVRTIHRWDKAGKLSCSRTVGGHRRISLSEVYRLLGAMHSYLIVQPSQKRCAIYARVSSHRQKKDDELDGQLKTLTDECKNRFKTSPLAFSDIGSGLNMRRRGLSNLHFHIEDEEKRTVVPTDLHKYLDTKSLLYIGLGGFFEDCDSRNREVRRLQRYLDRIGD